MKTEEGGDWGTGPPGGWGELTDGGFLELGHVLP